MEYTWKEVNAAFVSTATDFETVKKNADIVHYWTSLTQEEREQIRNAPVSDKNSDKASIC